VQSIGIALGGGGVRGMAHIGVLSALENLGVKIDHVAGTSAGAIVAALYAAGVDLKTLEEKVKNLRWRQIFEWDILWQRSIEGNKLLKLLLELLGENTTIESCPVRLSITAVELMSGRSVVFNKGSIIEAVRASIALPGFMRLVRNGQGDILVDGGVLGNVPVVPLRQAGCTRVIAIDVRDGVRQPHPKKLNSKLNLIYRVGEVMNHHITDLHLSMADLVIKPDVNGIGTFEIKKMADCIKAGIKAVQDNEDELGKLLMESKSTTPILDIVTANSAFQAIE
jgi:NTE family protein